MRWRICNKVFNIKVREISGNPCRTRTMTKVPPNPVRIFPTGTWKRHCTDWSAPSVNHSSSSLPRGDVPNQSKQASPLRTQKTQQTPVKGLNHEARQLAEDTTISWALAAAHVDQNPGTLKRKQPGERLVFCAPSWFRWPRWWVRQRGGVYLRGDSRSDSG